MLYTRLCYMLKINRGEKMLKLYFDSIGIFFKFYATSILVAAYSSSDHIN